MSDKLHQINRTSAKLTQDISLPGAKAMLCAAGLKPADFDKAQVGICSTGYEGNPCNMHLNGLADHVKKSVQDAGLIGWIFNTIGVSDGISNGTQGMRCSLPSREVIADSIEAISLAHFYDSNISIVGCDKNMPGALIAMGRLDRPSIMVYGGTIAPGRLGNRRLDIISAFEAYGSFLRKEIDEKQLNDVVESSCPGPGACGGMYTANTMAAAIETMGMALPYSSSNPAVSEEKLRECGEVGKAMRIILEKNITPRMIMTKPAFENAIAVVMALGGSTNAVLHLIAMARAVDVALTIDDFKRVGERTPMLADLRPSGQYLMQDLHEAGGTPAVLKLLIKEGLVDGNLLTVTGKTLGENVEALQGLREGQKVIFPVSNPVKPTGHIRILRGNLAPLGAVAKITGKEGLEFSGPACVFDSEDLTLKGIEAGKVKPGDVIVIWYEGPKGGPGMPEMLRITSAVMGTGLGKSVGMITDGRFSGGTHGFVIGHITPEAQMGGPLAVVMDGDIISIDARADTIEVALSDADLQARLAAWQAPPLRATRGVLAKYIKLVGDASHGCVTDEG